MNTFAKHCRAAGAAILTMALLVSGCADVATGVTKGVLDKVFEDTPPKIDATFVASPGLNPDPSGRPSPLVVRIYELKSLSSFSTAEFFTLYEQDASILGQDLLAKDELEVFPGQQLQIERELKMETRHIAVLAAFRDIDSAQWRATIDTPVDELTRFNVVFEPLAVRIEARKK